jgi:hypothetical protein
MSPEMPSARACHIPIRLAKDQFSMLRLRLGL